MRTKYGLTLIVSVILTGCVWYIYHLGGQRATLELRLHASDSTLAALSARQLSRDTIYRRDTLYLSRSVTKWRELEHWDTVTVPVPADTVRLIVATADTAIRACLVTVQTCEQRVAIRDSVIATLRAQRPLLQAQRPSIKGRIWWGLAGAAAGYIGGRFDH
jgi:hypothetical protein